MGTPEILSIPKELVSLTSHRAIGEPVPATKALSRETLRSGIIVPRIWKIKELQNHQPVNAGHITYWVKEYSNFEGKHQNFISRFHSFDP